MPAENELMATDADLVGAAFRDRPAIIESGTASLEAAVAAYGAALGVFTAEIDPNRRQVLHRDLDYTARMLAQRRRK